MAQHKLPVRQRPIRDSIEQLQYLRSQPEYYRGLLIDEAAEAAFAVDMQIAPHTQRKAVSRRFRSILQADVEASFEPKQVEPRLTNTYAVLAAAFQSVARIETQS